MSKDLWFAAMEQRMAELMDEGVPEAKAYDMASEQAHGIVRERLFDMADRARKIAKGE